MAPPPVPVVAVEVIVRDQPVYLESLAQAVGSQDVEIRARVAGILETVDFREGSYVEEGDLLYTIDPREIEERLRAVEGDLERARSSLDKATRDVARLTPLWEKNAISRQTLDDAIAAERSAKAAVDTAQANARNVRIQLGYAEIRAPISGLVGKTEVKPGNLVGQGQSTLLTTISTLDPINFQFSVSEQEYLRWRRAYPGGPEGREAPKGIFELILADGTVYPHRGDAVFADRNIDPQTGTLLLEVSFPNPDRLIRPGQFGTVRVPVRTVENAILVPQRAVEELQATYTVYVVEDGKAILRKVTPGPGIGDLYLIEDGLAPGDIVVIEGVQKLQNNRPVTATLQPAGDAPPAE